MVDPETEYLRRLEPDVKNRFLVIFSSRTEFGLEGCDGCEMPAHINPFLPRIANDQQFHLVDGFSHSAIELNGLKRDAELTDRPEYHRQDRFDPDALFAKLMKLGVPEEEFDVICASFKRCIACNGVFKTVGTTPTFEEAKAILEAELEAKAKED